MCRRVRAANEARFIIDLDGKTLTFRLVGLYRMQVMALLVCGSRYDGLTYLRWLIDCLECAPLSHYDYVEIVSAIARQT